MDAVKNFHGISGPRVPRYARLAGAVLFAMLKQTALVVTLAFLIIVTIYVAVQHYGFLNRLPSVSWRPVALAAPLAEPDLEGDPVRWVEIEATAAPPRAGTASRYRDSVESPGALILQFQADPGPAGRRRYRGILQTYGTRRARYRFPEALDQALTKEGITPGKKLAVLAVNRSPWPLIAPRLTEGLVVLGGICLALFLFVRLLLSLKRLLQSITQRPWAPPAGGITNLAWPNFCARCGQPMATVLKQASVEIKADLPLCPNCRRQAVVHIRKLRTLAVALAAAALSWGLYRSLRFRPVIPAGSFIALGLSGLCGLIGCAYNWRAWWLQPIFVLPRTGLKRQTQCIYVHKNFMAALANRISPDG